MRIHLMRTACIATVMAVVGTLPLFGPVGPRWLLLVIPLSNALWLALALALYRVPSLPLALLFGALSPIVGALLLGLLVHYPGVALILVFKAPYLFFPQGILTGYLVYWSARKSRRLEPGARPGPSLAHSSIPQ